MERPRAAGSIVEVRRDTTPDPPSPESDPEWIAAAFAAIGWSRPPERFRRYLAQQAAGERRGYVPDGRGIARRGRTVKYGEQVTVDDDLVLCLTRELPR